MEIKFKNGSTIQSINHIQVGRGSGKSYSQMKWIFGEVYKSLKWHQKLRLKFYYFMLDEKWPWTKYFIWRR